MFYSLSPDLFDEYIFFYKQWPSWRVEYRHCWHSFGALKLCYNDIPATSFLVINKPSKNAWWADEYRGLHHSKVAASVQRLRSRWEFQLQFISGLLSTFHFTARLQGMSIIWYNWVTAWRHELSRDCMSVYTWAVFVTTERYNTNSEHV